MPRTRGGRTRERDFGTKPTTPDPISIPNPGIPPAPTSSPESPPEEGPTLPPPTSPPPGGEGPAPPVGIPQGPDASATPLGPGTFALPGQGFGRSLASFAALRNPNISSGAPTPSAGGVPVSSAGAAPGAQPPIDPDQLRRLFGSIIGGGGGGF